MATPQTPQTPSRGSVLKRYTPFIAVIVVLAVVVLVIALVSGGDDDNGGSVSTNTDANGSTGATDFSDVPIFYNEAIVSGRDRRARDAPPPRKWRRMKPNNGNSQRIATITRVPQRR